MDFAFAVMRLEVLGLYIGLSVVGLSVVGLALQSWGLMLDLQLWDLWL